MKRVYKILFQVATIENMLSSDVRIVHCVKGHDDWTKRNPNVYCDSSSDCVLCNKGTNLKQFLEMKARLEKFDSEEELDIKSCVKKLVRRYVGENYLSLTETQKLLAEELKAEFSDLDLLYIQQKYFQICFELWLEDTFVTCSRSINLENCQIYLESFLKYTRLTIEVPIVFSGSKYLKILQQHDKTQNDKEIIPRDMMKEYLKKFKSRLEFLLLKLSESMRKELEFISSLIGHVRSVKDIRTCIESFKLAELVENRMSFQDFRSHMIGILQATSGTEKAKLLYVKLLLLDNVNSLTQVDRLQTFVEKYSAAPTIKLIPLEGSCELEVQSMALELSNIKPDLDGHLEHVERVSGLRFVIGDVLHLDVDLEGVKYRGVNINICCQQLVVHGPVKIDVSGNDCLFSYDGVAGRCTDGSGRDGLDGHAGESGGNIVITYDEIVNADLLTLISYGGKGGNGQHGGDGADGEKGAALSSTKVTAENADFGSPVKFFSRENRQLHRMRDNIETESGNNLSKDNMYDGKMATSVFVQGKNEKTKVELFFSANKSWWSPNLHAFFLCQGGFGETGKLGGTNGLGGQGGFSGDIDIDSSDVQILAENGQQGEKGISGFNGRAGENGWDIGWLDFRYWNNPLLRGENQNCKLELVTHTDSVENSVYCDNYEKYVTIKEKVRSKDTTYERQRQKQCERTEHQKCAQATKKNMTTRMEMMVQYGEVMTAAKNCTESFQVGEELEYIKMAEKVLKDAKDEALDEEKVEETVQMAREASLEDATKVSRNVYRKKKEFTSVSLVDENGELLRNWSEVYKNIDFLKSTVHKILTSSPKRNISQVEDLVLKSLALEHYKIEKLGEIHQHVNKLKTDNFELVPHLHQNCLTVSKDSSEISHTDLNNIENFVLTDSFSTRAQLIDHCKKASNLDQAIENALKIFLTQTFEIDDKDKLEKYEQHYKKYAEFEIMKQVDINKSFSLLTVEIETVEKLLEPWNKFLRNEIGLKEMKKHIKDEKRDDLKQMFKLLCQLYDKEFEFSHVLEDSAMMSLFYETCRKKGLQSDCYIELLAGVFEAKIDTYEEIGSQFKWKTSYNLEGRRHLLLSEDDQRRYQVLIINQDQFRVLSDRYYRSKIYDNLLHNIMCRASKSEVDFFSKKIIGQKISEFVVNDDHLACLCEEEDAKYITNQVKPENYSKCLKALLQLRNIKQNLILHSLAQRLALQRCEIDEQELMFLINHILRSYVENTQQVSIVNWIISTQPQRMWLPELTLLNMENKLKISFQATKNFLLNKLSQINLKHDLLVYFNIQLQSSDADPMNTEQIHKTLDLMLKVDQVPQKIYEVRLSNWIYLLENQCWRERLSQLFQNQPEEVLNTATYYVQSIESYYEGKLVNDFLDALYLKREYVVDPLHFLSQLNIGEWKLDKHLVTDFKSLSDTEDVLKLEKKLSKQKRENCDRGIPELFDVIKQDAKTTAISKDTCKNIRDLWSSEELIGNRQKLVELASESQLRCYREVSLSKPELETFQLLDRIDHCIFLKRKFRLREAQKLSILILLTNPKSTLIQVATGEGKTLIVVAAAIMKVKKGQQVDVITSSSVLAKRDALANKDIYDFFNVSVHHNCDEDVQKRITAYSKNKVIYGDISNFQRDYLLDRFYAKNILGGRKFENLIVDEVDSMLLDKGNNMLYLSHDLPWLDKLLPVYVYIWQWVNQPTSTPQQIQNVLNPKILEQNILHDILGLVTIEDVKQLDCSMSDEDANNIYEELKKNGTLNEDGTLQNVDFDVLETSFDERYRLLSGRMKFLLKEVERREVNYKIPNFLKPFVVRHLQSWIKSAHNALMLHEKVNYMVDVNRKEGSSEINPNIIILDTDTGTDQSNSQWDEALHQFLQLKHGCQVSSQTLKAVYTSNVSFFKLYNNVNGLTGTLGSKSEMDLLKKIYNAEFLRMPTSKPKQFTEYLPELCTDPVNWLDKLKKEALEITRCKRRSVLIICETVEYVEKVKRVFTNEDIPVRTYTRDYEDFDFDSEKPLQVGQILISTNLAGRGTDIKISEEMIANGGLHVLLAYLPPNNRIEQQAFGRAARCGEPGSAKLIVLDSQDLSGNFLLLRKLRDDDEIERISRIDSYYNLSIRAQEDCFELFRDFYSQCKNWLHKKVNKLQRALKSKLSFTIDAALSNPTFMMLNKKESVKKQYSASFDNWGKNLVGSAKPVREIILQTLLDEWAYWLDSQSLKIKSIADREEYISIIASAKEFINTLKDRIQEHRLLNSNPASLMKLGKLLMKQGDFREAIKMFDAVIASEPNHAEGAHYYKAYAEGTFTDWSLVEEQVNPSLREAKKLFQTHILQCNYHSGVIARLKMSNSSRIVKIEAFEKQQENLIQIYNTFSNSIDDILGHGVSEHDFAFEDTSSKIQSELLFKHFQDKSTLSKTCLQECSEAKIKGIEDAYGIKDKAVFKILDSLDGVFNEETFTEAFGKIENPCSEQFWALLLQENALKNVELFVEVLRDQVQEFDDKICEEIFQCKELTLDKICFTMHPISQQEGTAFLSKQDVEHAVGCKMKCLIKNGLIKENAKAVVDFDTLKRIDLSLKNTIQLGDIISLGIGKLDADNILKQLESDGYLKKHDEQSYVLHDVTKNFYDINIRFSSVYNNALIMLMTYNFCYQKTIQRMLGEPKIKSVEGLPRNVCSAILSQMIEEGFVVQPTVQLNGELDYGEGKFHKKLTDGFKNTKAERSVVKKLDQKRSVLKKLEAPKGKLENILSYHTNCSNDVLKLLRDFDASGLNQVIVFVEKQWTTKMLASTFVIAALGVAQMAIGIAIQVYSVGALAPIGTGFLNEGVNDLMFAMSAMWSGHFSWTNYAKQKMISIGITVATCGVAAYLSRGSKVSRFGSKLFKAGKCSSSELVGSALIKDAGLGTVLKECGKTIGVQALRGLAYGTVSAGVDHVVQNYLKRHCDKVAEQMLGSMEDALRNHRIHKSVEQSYFVLGAEKAARLISELTQDHFDPRYVKRSLGSYLAQYSDMFVRAVMDVNKMSPVMSNSSAALVQLFRTGATVAAAGFNFLMITDATASYLEEMNVKLREALIGKKGEHAENPQQESLEHFQLRIAKMWKDKLMAVGGQQIARDVVSPILKMCGNMAVEAVGRGIQKCYKHFMGDGARDLEKEEYLKSKKDEDNVKVEEHSEVITEKQYQENEKLGEVIEEMKTTNPKEHAAVVRRDVPMDMTCVLAAVHIAEEKNNEKIEIVVVDEDRNTEFKINSSSSGEEVPKKQIVLYLKDNHFRSSKDVEPGNQNLGNNDCLYQALMSECDLGMSAGEFRASVADRIETGPCSEFVKSGQHNDFLERNFIGGTTGPTRTNKVVKLSSTSTIPAEDRPDGSYACTEFEREGKKPCKTCPFMEPATVVRTPTGDTIEIKGHNTCSTKKVVYMLECVYTDETGKTVCSDKYIGKTKNQLRMRAGSHIRSVEQENVDRNFTLREHSESHGNLKFNFKFTILESIDEKSTDTVLRSREQHWINIFSCPRWEGTGKLLNKINAVRSRYPPEL